MRRSRAPSNWPGPFFAARSWAGCTTNMFGFDLRQAQGRAGRRGAGLSVALTLCRGRSHDDYYFQRPDRITSDPPPPPYVDTNRLQILRRVLNKEVLRAAFSELQLFAGSDGDSVHGEFGRADGWNRP